MEVVRQPSCLTGATQPSSNSLFSWRYIGCGGSVAAIQVKCAFEVSCVVGKVVSLLWLRMRPAESVVQGRTTGYHRELASMRFTEVSHGVVAVLCSCVGVVTGVFHAVYVYGHKILCLVELLCCLYAVLLILRIARITAQRLDRPVWVRHEKHHAMRELLDKVAY